MKSQVFKKTSSLLLVAGAIFFSNTLFGIEDTKSSPKKCPPSISNGAQDCVCKDDSGIFLTKHKNFLSIAKEKRIGVLFIGDSITEGWTNRRVSGIKTYKKVFTPYEPANFGISGDKTQNIIWRITEGAELEPMANRPPRVVVLMIGTNNIHSDSSYDISSAVKKIVSTIRSKLPKTKILLIGILPRARVSPDFKVEDINAKIDTINSNLEKLDEKYSSDYKRAMVRFLNVKEHIPHFNLNDFNDAYLYDCRKDKSLSTLEQKDCSDYGLHLSPGGYEKWGNLINSYLQKLYKFDSNGNVRPD